MKCNRFAFLPILVLLGGCARVATTTTLRADGSYSRKVVYAVSKNSMGAVTGQSEKPAADKPEDFFKLPVATGDLQVTRTDDEQTVKVTVSRLVPAGVQPLQDVTLLAEKAKPMATSTVSVRKLADGRIEYVETLHTMQPNPQAKDFVIPDLRARVKKALPAEFQKTDLIDAATKAVMINLAHGLFGPPEPSLFNFFLSPEATARRVNAFVYTANLTSLREVVPSMSPDQAKDAAHQLIDILNEKTLTSSGPSTMQSGPDQSGPNALTPLYFETKFAGKVVETNGIIDPVTGDVYWSLLAPVLDLSDVQLRLVIQP